MNKRQSQLRMMIISDMKKDGKVSGNTLRLIVESRYNYHSLCEGLEV